MGRQFPFLRGLAILFILVNHSIVMSLWAADRLGLPWPAPVLSEVMIVLQQIGLITVPIFLFLSGAFFAYGVQNRPIRGSFRIVWKNVLGVLWPYLIWAIVFNLMVSFLLGEHFTPLQFLKNILVGYPYSFVPLLLFFYVLAPFLVWGMKRIPALTLLAFLIYQLFLIVEENPGIMGFAFPLWAHYFAPLVIREPLSFWAVFFPLGVFYQIYARSLVPWLRKTVVPIVIGLVVFAVLGDLHDLRVIVFPMAKYIVPLFFILLIPLIQRKTSPAFLWVEAIGKRSYGFYLLNLVVINLALLALQAVFPWILGQYLLIVPLLFLLALYVSWGLMRLVELSPQRNISRYIFG